MSTQERHPQIPKPEVKELFRTLRATGDQEIRTRLIEGHLGLGQTGAPGPGPAVGSGEIFLSGPVATVAADTCVGA